MAEKQLGFESFNWDHAEWKAYLASVTIPDPSKQSEIVEKLKRKWYKKNIDPDWDYIATTPSEPILEVFPVGPLSCNCSIFADPVTKEGVLVDPGGDPDIITQKLKAANVTVKYIFITHAHFDHFLAADIIKKHTGAPVILHKEDLQLWQMKDLQCNLFGIPNTLGPVSEPSQLLSGNEVFEVNPTMRAKALHTPGHTPGSTCFHFDTNGIIFTGDTLFKGSVGRTDLWGGDKNALIKSIREQLYPLPDHTVVISGHGAKTTIGQEKLSNPFLKASI
jgi:glyoxylase-like metal-dependent hydrolase (beta-lactamase superfamily II)